MTIALITVSLFSIISIFININAYRKELALEKRVRAIDFMTLDLVNRIKYSIAKLDALDKKGAFQSDDEVGYFFIELKKIGMILNVYTENVSNANIYSKEELNKLGTTKPE